MSKNTIALKNSIDAHGWLGVIFSFALFLIFWAGAVSLFKVEIQHWAESPSHFSTINHSITINGEAKKVSELLQQKLTEYPVDRESRITINMPGKERDYYLMHLKLLDSENSSEKSSTRIIKVDPNTGETLGDSKQFSFAHFMFELHHNLHWPDIGVYITGFVALFFLLALFSGIYIHSNKIISNFFKYRPTGRRTQFRDLHNLVGVISLPYTLMYAITGAIFNLALIFQITFVVFLYQGDTETLLNDVGLPKVPSLESTGTEYNMENLSGILDSVNNEYGPVNTLRIADYGDQAATVEFQGEYDDRFATRYMVKYDIFNQEKLIETGVAHNGFQKAYETLNTLHYGSFGGLDLRFMYFLLAMSVLAMIIAGNLLWVEKRDSQSSYARSTYLISKLTLGSCIGLIIATAVGLLLERGISPEMTDRHQIVIASFILILAASLIAAFITKSNHRFITLSLYLTAIVLIVIVAVDWVMYSQEILEMTKGGDLMVIGVEIALLLFSVLCSIVGFLIQKVSSRKLSEEHSAYITP